LPNSLNQGISEGFFLFLRAREASVRTRTVISLEHARSSVKRLCDARAFYCAKALFDRATVAIEYASLHVPDPNR
jgi:hypothetical protein